MNVTYSQEIAEQVCELIASGLSLRSIGKIDGMPAPSTVLSWCLQHREFMEQYAQARKLQAMLIADEVLDIADDSTNDTQIDDEGNEIVNHDHISRARLRVDTRKWYLSKVFPKVFGPQAPNPPEASQRIVRTVVPNVSSEPVERAKVERYDIEDIQKEAGK